MATYTRNAGGNLTTKNIKRKKKFGPRIPKRYRE